jgi:hypothetical protein
VCASCASTGLCGGQRVTVVPTATLNTASGHAAPHGAPLRGLAPKASKTSYDAADPENRPVADELERLNVRNSDDLETHPA